MKFKVKLKENQLLVNVKLSYGQKLNRYQLDLFMSKSIRGLFRAKPVNNKKVDYTAPIGRSLQNRLQTPISKYDFLFIMEQIVDLTQKLNINALTINSIIFDYSKVFINDTTKELQFIYLPIENSAEKADILNFISQIIHSAQPLPENDMNYISRFAFFINDLHAFDAEKTEQFIYEEDPKIVNIIKRHNVGHSGFMTDKQEDYVNHYKNRPDWDDMATALMHDEATDLLEDESTRLLKEEDTGILGDENTGMLDDEATGLLNENSVANDTLVNNAKLYRMRTGDMVYINKMVFRIGKLRNNSDYVIWDNNMVSSNHANIIRRGNRHFIVDLNSQNRTYVNSYEIPSQQEFEIHDGDQIRLANEEFKFLV